MSRSKKPIAGGFDCPGCAWPEGGERIRFDFCENGIELDCGCYDG